MTRARTTSRKKKPRRILSYRRLRRKTGRDLAFVDVDGRRHYLGQYDTPESRERYHRFIAEWEAGGRSLPVEADDITVVEVANEFLKWARGYYVMGGKPTAEPRNIALALRPLKKLYGRSPASKFGPRALKAVRTRMVESDWSRKHINRQIGIIKRMFKWAVAEEMVPPSLYHSLQAVMGLKRGRCGARETLPIPPAPVELIEPTKCRASRQIAAMIELQSFTGARPGEIVIIRPCDIDRSGPVWRYTPADHKTKYLGHDRVIFIGPKGQKVLEPFLLRPSTTYCFSPIDAEQDRRALLSERRVTPLSCGNRPGTNRLAAPKRPPGEHYTTESYGRAVRRACEKAFPLPEPLAKRDDETQKEYDVRLSDEQKAELKAWRREHHWYPNQLRHTYATRVRKQFGLEAAQVLLGHSSADVTQIYAERDMDRAATVAAKIG